MSWFSGLFNKGKRDLEEEVCNDSTTEEASAPEIIESEDEHEGLLQGYESYLEKAETGDKASMYEAGRLLLTYAMLTETVHERADEAFLWLKKAADEGVIEAYRYVGEYFWITKEYETALEWYKKGAAEKDIEALKTLGDIYTLDKGVDFDPFESFAYYHQAAELGDVSSMAKVGMAYFEGSVVEQDKEEAFHYLKKHYDMADYHDKQCNYRLAQYYLNGECVEKDAKEAIRILEESCNCGGLLDEDVVDLLLYCYENENDGEVNYKKINELRWKLQDQQELFESLANIMISEEN